MEYLTNTKTYFISDIVTHPTDSQTLYAGTIVGGATGGIFQSTNGGTTWSNIAGDAVAGSGLGNDASPIAIDPLDPRHMYAGGVHSIFFRSIDTGYHWTLQNPLSGVEGFVPQEGLAINPRNPAQIYLGVSIFSPQKLPKTFLSTDYGMSWAEFTQIQGAIESLKFAPSAPDRVYSISQTDPQRPFNPNQAFLYRSYDNGVAWTNLGSHTHGLRTVTIDPTDPNHLYVGTRRGGVIQSFDGGQSFPLQ